MTDLERLRPTVNARQQLSEQEADAIIDTHLKEDAERDTRPKYFVKDKRYKELEAELTELRERNETGARSLAVTDETLAATRAQNESLRQVLRQAEAELAELREAVRAWDKASRIWFDTAQGRPFDPEEAARKSIERRKTEDRLRQLIEEKP